MKTWSHPAECAEQSAHSEEKASSKQSLWMCGFPAELRLQWRTEDLSEGTSHCGEDRTERDKQDELTNKSSLRGSKHSDGTVFVVIPLTSNSSGQAGWHVEVGANESAYATTEESLTAKWHMGAPCLPRPQRNLLLICNSRLTFGVEALGHPVLPKNHIHPLAMATHKQSHLRQGGLTSCPHHLM